MEKDEKIKSSDVRWPYKARPSQLLSLSPNGRKLAFPLRVKKKERLGKEIEQLDEGINRLVYGLYGLTGEEIALVEKETGGK